MNYDEMYNTLNKQVSVFVPVVRGSTQSTGTTPITSVASNPYILIIGVNVLLLLVLVIAKPSFVLTKGREEGEEGEEGKEVKRLSIPSILLVLAITIGGPIAYLKYKN